MVGKLIREGSKNIKSSFESLLAGEHLITPIDEQIVYSQLNGSEQEIGNDFYVYMKSKENGLFIFGINIRDHFLFLINYSGNHRVFRQ